MAKQWSLYSKEQQRKNIMSSEPWLNSTGPTSASGKSKSSRNADKGKTPLREIQKMITKVHKERLELLRWIEDKYSIKIKF